MKPLYYYQPLLLLAAALATGCSSSSDEFWADQPPQPLSELTWTAYGYGEKDSIDGVTRALFYGGNGGGRYYNLWDEGDQVKVYKDGVYKGYQTPTTYGRVNTELTGTLTGTFAVNDALKMYVLGPDLDFTGQNGKIGKMSDTFAYQVAEDVVVETVDGDGQILTFTGGSFINQQAFFRFMLTDSETGNRLHIRQLEISTDANKLVQTKALGGDAVYGNLVVTATQEDNEYPADMFVAVRTENESADTWHFKAYVGEDIYYGPTDRALTYEPTNGRLANIVRTMTKTTAASTLTVDAITDQTFTGSAIEPVVTVRDGEDVLTLGTDYSVAYTGNVNVGEATATITGLADAGATAATKYLGTKSTTFNIVQATPVIDMTSTDMTLVNNATPAQNSGTRTVTRVFVDNNGNGTWDEGTDCDITALCTVTYATASDAVATVNASSGTVTAAGPGTTTVTATVASATNWTTQTASYTVKVEQEVNGQNSVGDWGNGGTTTDKTYVE